MKRKIIKVTNRDIKLGEKEISFMCPIALALKRNGFENPRVYGKYCLINGIMTREIIDLPKKVLKFVKDFDEGKKVKPFAFQFTY